MKKKTFSILICPFAILVFCSFFNPTKDNSRISFSAEITSVRQDTSRNHGKLNIATIVTVWTYLKNNSDHTIILLEDACNWDHALIVDSSIFKKSFDAQCYWGGVCRRPLAPHSTQVRWTYYTLIEKKSKRPVVSYFRIGYNFVTLDMFPTKDFIPNAIHQLVPPLKDFDTTKNIIWSDTLVIK